MPWQSRTQDDPTLEIKGWRRWRAQALGYDVFLSYRRADGSRYAAELEVMLASQGILAFRDAAEIPPAEAIDTYIPLALSRSTMLVVIGSPDALEHKGDKVDWVAREASDFFGQEFGRAERCRRLFFGKRRGTAIVWPPTKQVPWPSLHDKLRIEESAEHTTVPSEAVVAQIAHSLRFFRVQRLTLAASVLAPIALALLILGWLFESDKRKDAERHTASLQLASRSDELRERAPGFAMDSLRTAVAAYTMDPNLATATALRTIQDQVPDLFQAVSLPLGKAPQFRARTSDGGLAAFSDGKDLALLDLSEMIIDPGPDVDWTGEIHKLAIRAEPDAETVQLVVETRSHAQASTIQMFRREAGTWQPAQPLDLPATTTIVDLQFCRHSDGIYAVTGNGEVLAWFQGKQHLAVKRLATGDRDRLLQLSRKTLLHVRLKESITFFGIADNAAPRLQQSIKTTARDAIMLGNSLVVLRAGGIDRYEPDEKGAWAVTASGGVPSTALELGVIPARQQDTDAQGKELWPGRLLVRTTHNVSAYRIASTEIVQEKHYAARCSYRFAVGERQDMCSADGTLVLCSPALETTGGQWRGSAQLRETGGLGLRWLLPVHNPTTILEHDNRWVIVDKTGHATAWRLASSCHGVPARAKQKGTVSYWTFNEHDSACAALLGPRDPVLVAWDGSGTRSEQRLDKGLRPYAMRMANDGSLEMVTDKGLRSWSKQGTERPTPASQWIVEALTETTRTRAAFSQDGHHLALWTGRKLLIGSTSDWQLKQQMLWPATSRDEPLTRPRFSPDGRWLALNYSDVVEVTNALPEPQHRHHFDSGRILHLNNQALLVATEISSDNGSQLLQIRSLKNNQVLAHGIVPYRVGRGCLLHENRILVSRQRRIESWRLGLAQPPASKAEIDGVWPYANYVARDLIPTNDGKRVFVVGTHELRWVDISAGPTLEHAVARVKAYDQAMTPR